MYQAYSWRCYCIIHTYGSTCCSSHLPGMYYSSIVRIVPPNCGKYRVHEPLRRNSKYSRYSSSFPELFSLSWELLESVLWPRTEFVAMSSCENNSSSSSSTYEYALRCVVLIAVFFRSYIYGLTASAVLALEKKKKKDSPPPRVFSAPFCVLF